MRYPVSTTIITEARMYCRESISHTYNYDGWKDEYKKDARIITGKFTQLWLTEFCRFNGIKHKKDTSSPLITDSGDLLINGWNIDCKATINDKFAGQVSSNHDRPGNSIDAYFFMATNRLFEYVEPLGVVKYDSLHDVADKIKKGELIPGTNLIQSFEYSYFIPISKMSRFEDSIKYMSENAKM